MMRNTSEIEWELAITKQFSPMYQRISMEKLKALQNAYLEMFLDFDQECEKLDLKSYMVAGTLIGSLRHEGFIPWDDDIDLVMFREDYEKLKKFFSSDKFNLIDPVHNQHGIHKMMKIESKNLSYYDVLGEGFSKSKKLYLDMLPIDFVPENAFYRKMKGLLLRLMDLSYSSSRCFNKYSPHLNYMANYSSELKINLFIRKLVGLPAILIGPNNLFKLMDNFLKNQKQSKKVTIAFGVKGYLGEVIDYSTFYPAKKLPFEGYEFYGPNDAHDYLTNRYGNYMEIPDSKEQLERHVRLRDDWERVKVDKI